MRSLVITSVILLLSIVSFASHSVGSSIRYDYLGLGSAQGTYKYKITVSVVRACAGIPYTNSRMGQEKLWARCGNTTLGPFSLKHVPVRSKSGQRYNPNQALDISNYCTSVKSSCELSTVTPGGYEMYQMEYDVDLTACTSWEFRFVAYDCCRATYSTFTGGGYHAAETVINTMWKSQAGKAGPPENSAPIFANEVRRVESACVGQNMLIDASAFDREGDSLTYSMTCPWGASARGTFNPFLTMNRMVPQNPITCKAPIPNFKLDTSAGTMTFRSNIAGSILMAYYVNEYDRCSGVLTGRTYRELQVDISSCGNNVPRSTGASNLSSNAKKIGANTMEVCQGQNLTWQDTIYDLDVLDTVILSSNIQQRLPGASYTVTSISRNRSVIHYSWKSKFLSGRKKVVHTSFNDNRCNRPGWNYSNYIIDVVPAVEIHAKDTICKGDTIHLEVEGSNKLGWISLSGDPIQNGINWFPDTATGDTNVRVQFIPSQTTTLAVQSSKVLNACGDLMNKNCGFADTIVVFVADSFSIQTTPDFTSCYGQNSILEVNPSQATFSYQYEWSPTHLLTSSQTAKTSFSKLSKATTFRVKVNSGGCVREGKVRVDISEPFPNDWKLHVSDTPVCISDTLSLWLTSSLDYGSCGISQNPCQGNFVNHTVVNGNSTNLPVSTTRPVVYASQNVGAKIQYHYEASVLNSMGLQSGPIESIAWQIDSIYTSSMDSLKNYTIRVGCSDGIQVFANNAFEYDLETVFDAKTIGQSSGWNEYQFDREYNWDGKSDLLVEVVWTQDSGKLFNNVQLFDPRSSKTAIAYYQSSKTQADVNSVSLATSSYSYLPNTRFSSCVGRRTSRYVYNWSNNVFPSNPGSNLDDSVLALANLSSNNNFQVIVQDSGSQVCQDTMQVSVRVLSSYNAKPIVAGPYCINNGYIQFTRPTNVKKGLTAKWSGVGIIDSINGIWDPIQSGQGNFSISFEVLGDACASKDSSTLTISAPVDPYFTGPDSICSYEVSSNKYNLNANTPGGTYTGSGLDSVSIGGGQYQYFINPTRFSPQLGMPDTAHINYSVSNGCNADSTRVFKIVAPWDSTYLGVLDQGVANLSPQLCGTNPMNDTLLVAGEGAIWECLNIAQAMVDSTEGIFSARQAAQGSRDTKTAQIKVTNPNAFCPSSNTISISIVSPPEIEIIEKTYCEPWLSDPNNRFYADTIWLRIPKGSLLSGSTGTKDLDSNGFNAQTEVKVYYAGIGQSGWPDAYDLQAEQYLFNFWDGNPWMTLPNVARFRPGSMNKGVYKIRYQYAMVYRQSAGHTNFCFEYDTAEIHIADSLPMQLNSVYSLCNIDTITLDPGQFSGSYSWSTGDSTQQIEVTKAGSYSVSITDKTCSGSQSTLVTYCTSIQDDPHAFDGIKLFPNPVDNMLNIEFPDLNDRPINIKVYDALGGEVLVQNLTSGQEQVIKIDMGEFESGIYLMKLVLDGQSITYRIIKQ